ncbi:MAG: sulfite exporter TauE/SafE family protein [Dehalococcoidales bacterium]|nr:sulfite exporter TauE/SafE family protein [Dehalococcoidales bacterium]
MGLFIGAFGTLIGVAGGFLLVPILLFLYPGETAATITSTTLVVAFFNALSGSLAYMRLRRIDFRSGWMFSLTAVPGAIIGAYIVTIISRNTFQYVFGAVLLVVAAYLLARPQKKIMSGGISQWQAVRRLTDSNNNVYEYSFDRILGLGFAFIVGIMAGLLGIGGGIIHVPVMIQVLNFPAHIATATSHFVVVISIFAAIMTHITSATFVGEIGRVIALSAGAVIGAQFGARLSRKVTGVLIIRLLAIGLAIIALRLLIAPF